MGKGGGCVPSKKARHVLPSSPRTHTSPPAPIPYSGDLKTTHVTTSSQPQPPRTRPLRIFVVFYSMYGHVEILARTIKKGIDTVEGVEGVLFRVPETLSEEALEQMMVPDKGNEIPYIDRVDMLEQADGILFGFPTRFGAMPAQMKAFFDSMGGRLWLEQRLAKKPAGFFVSTGTQGGGQETTAWTAITQLVHHGMIYVPIGYTFGDGMHQLDEIRGGSPYGAGVVSGDGSRPPTKMELALSEHHGKYMASIVKRLVQ
ncbi:NAD(P)H dehydrogenase (quinone) [Rhynchospora pubera]|uniref:NAD(P)H dehydrogenase (quinone) n=1 Tax=Rhynchospora pubera TaxID=906938 RepID=A0AAV8CK45_9POAL|nr:NAD(P)H dehydrogenase (quinone) [Rhynchospora pubera]KAJ4814656.1 NAD(P)H dehydrogenase (quinone) [Rhynchospora pubera]